MRLNAAERNVIIGETRPPSGRLRRLTGSMTTPARVSRRSLRRSSSAAVAAARGQQPPASRRPRSSRRLSNRRAAAARQQPQQQPPPRIRTGINYVSVDVIVTDKNGRPGARPEAGRLRRREDGKPQKIDSLRRRQDRRGSRSAETRPPQGDPQRLRRGAARRRGPTCGCSSSCSTTTTCGAATTWRSASRSSTSSRTSSRRRTWWRSCTR